jgi:type I restriction enzyme, R subunit
VGTTLIFPRLHQWDVVTRLVESSRSEGPGHRYLVQHSAGSGKTGSISWTAHRLSKLHAENDDPVFDTVIVITDRTVLDSQLQQAIRQIEPGAGYISTVDDAAIRNAGEGASKSTVLANELVKGTRIVVVTIQTFPHAMEAIRKHKGLAGKRFAVIADEAHSSQTGQTASKLKAVLSAEELADVEDGGEIDVEAVLAAETAARADSSNISYYAFTATPKAKTLELFGRPGGDGKPVPFHVYTMKQAIEERFILDVLRGYQTYTLAFQIAQRTENGDELVDQAAATKGLVRWVALHPTNIAQRVRIVVEHYRANVAHLLGGHAKAMVVTDSRKAAVRYKLEIDRYIADRGYEIGTLVAFSGSVDDPESGPNAFTEASMNTNLRGRDLPSAFASGEFQIMLVANKFQTGFDQPLLSAMYVFKRLAGVAAVQTLSRLNRTYVTPTGKVKDTTMVLDFVNDAAEIRSAFEPYFKDAWIETETDPNIVNDIAAKLDQSNLYTQAEIDQAAAAWVAGTRGKGGGNNALAAAVQPAQRRFLAAYRQAESDTDRTELAKMDLFRNDVAAFVRVYDFISQVIDYGAEMEKRANFYRLLERVIRPGSSQTEIDLGDVALRNVAQVDRGASDIKLGVDADAGLRGITGAGSGARRDAKMVALQEVIDRLNDLFGDEAFTAGQKQTFVEGLLNTLLGDATLVGQARVNTKKQFLESPHLTDGVLDAVSDNNGAHNQMADVFYSDTSTRAEIVRLVGGLLYEWVAEAG